MAEIQPNPNPCPQSGASPTYGPLQRVMFEWAHAMEFMADELAEVTDADPEWCEDCEMCAFTHEQLTDMQRRMRHLAAFLHDRLDTSPVPV